MEYDNPIIPEGINTSKENPLKEFFILTIGIFSAIFIVFALLAYLANYLALYIPFETELRLSKTLTDHLFLEKDLSPNQHQETQLYLQQLADKIAIAQGLPAEMKIIVHYTDDETVNAFATLGGNIFMFRGLLEKLPNENAVAMVLAHEIAHIKYRHPICSMSRGVIIGLALATINGNFGNSIAQEALTNGTGLAGLKFSRNQENQADQEALKTLVKLYGHVNGAKMLFNVLEKESQGIKTPAFLSTHPLSNQRIQNIDTFQHQRQLVTNPDLIPLPVSFLK